MYPESGNSGSVSLLVVGILTGCLGLVAGMHAWLNRDSVELRIQRNQMIHRSALQLGLREAMKALADDEMPSVDDRREPWGEPLNFVSSDGVALNIQISDALDRFNVNHLSLEMTPDAFRTPEQMLTDLMKSRGIEDAELKAASITQEVSEWEEPLVHPSQLLSLIPDEGQTILVLMPHLSALPRPQGKFLKMNLNSVQPEVLIAVLGPQFSSWVDAVVELRASAPISSVSLATAGLPSIAQTALERIVDVRSTLFMIQITSQTDIMTSSMEAIVLRSSGGDVEVLQCLW